MNYLKSMLTNLGLPCGGDVMEQFEQYRRSILKWNESVNLTAVRDEESFEIRHFADSLMICRSPRMGQARRVIDVGTGAGFPGIPLAIVFPEKQFTLMDSLGKRMKIVEQTAHEIGLQNVEVIHARAEELGKKKEYREQYDLCVSRAVANLSVLSEYCLPFVKVGGWFAPYKTAAAEEEIREGRKAVEILGGRLLEDRIHFDLKEIRDEEKLEHTILWIEKITNTLTKYPRKAGTPAKDPLK
ncbi:16S rRNA (guanine(527)-N(7))-methyltransferase RsmG [Bacilliculturomica massiliensis]|uniref:16S rRNA (guanine(527)-N(7))-methyltransferase RsmG n=1 Tax=Bacilliculturomica massiliensis TaxID=1917867 RepID=UPI001FE6E15F|nr:16S rRNA (guanine(527)-N(7))-methyltransferase RsmG [Bacilliculturomica massiliensis]